MLNESHRLQLLSQRIQAQDPDKTAFAITNADDKNGMIMVQNTKRDAPPERRPQLERHGHHLHNRQ